MKLKNLLPLLVGVLVMAGCGNTPTEQPSTDQTPTEQPTTEQPTTEVPSDPEFEAVSLDVIKTTYKNNQEVQVEGVVYGVTTNGFFLADSESSYIFVNMGDNWSNPVKIGDKVQVEAKFSLVSGYCMLKQAQLNVVAQNNPVPVVAAEKEFSFVNELVASPAGDYGMLVKLVGTLSANGAAYVLTNDSGETVDLASNSAALLNEFVGKRVTLEAVVYKTNSEGKWQLVFAGDDNDIVDSTLTFADYVALAQQELNTIVPSTCTGNLTLPSNHKVDSTLTYTWAVKSGTSITIVDNIATVVPPATDEEVVLTVTIAKGENSQEVDFTITSKAVVDQTVAEFMADLPLSGDAVKVTGVVVAMGRNQGSTTEPYAASKRYVVVQDETTTDSVPVNYYYNSNEFGFEGLSIGDKVAVSGTWSDLGGDTDNPTINASSIALISEGASYTDAKESAIVISTAEQYEDLGKNPENYVGKLLKFDNPYLVYSTTGEPNPSNWVRFGATSRVDKVGNKSLATLIGLGNENIDEGWNKHFDIAYSGTDGRQFGGDIYAYLVYKSSSYLQLCIPSVSYIQLDNASQQAAYEQVCVLPETVDSNSSLKLEEGFTYTFDNEIIDATGKVGTALVNTAVNVTVTKDDYSFTKTVTVISASTYELTVGEETNGTTSLSNTTGLLEGDEVTATFAPAEGYVTVSYTVATENGSVKYPAYKQTSATISVPGTATVTAEYGLAENYTTFNWGPSTNAVLWYDKDGNGSWSSSSTGGTARDYDYVIERIKDVDGNPINRDLFTFSADGLATGKFMNFKASSSDYEGNFLCIYGAADDASTATLTSAHEIYSITVTYVSTAHFGRSTVYSGENVVEGTHVGDNAYTYLIDNNSFSISNASGSGYLYIRSVEIVYAAPSAHGYESDAEGHWASCPSCDFTAAKEAHTYENCAYVTDDEGHAKVCTVCEYEAAKENHTYVDGACECGKLEPTSGVTYASTTIDANNANPTSKLLYGNEKGEWVLSSNVIDEATFAQYVCDTAGNPYDTALFDFKAIANAETGKVLNFSYSSKSYENRVIQIQPTAGITIECQQKIAYIVVTYATNNSVDNYPRGLIKVNDAEVTGTQQGEGSVYQYTVNANSVTIMSNATSTTGDSVFLYSIEIVYEAQ
jgi:hypothetical protein